MAPVEEALGIMLRMGDPEAPIPPPEALLPPPPPLLAKAFAGTAATVLRPELQGALALVAVLLIVLAPNMFPSLAWKVGLLVGVFVVLYLLPVFASRRSRERLADLVTTHRGRFSAGALLLFVLGGVVGSLMASRDPQPSQPLLDARVVQIPPELLGAMPAAKCRLSPRQVERAPSRIEHILQRGHLVVRVQDPRSFAAQLLSAVATKWDIPVTWVTTAQGDDAQALQRGALDILATQVVHTIQADQQMDFSQTYLLGAQGEPYAFGLPSGETTFRLLLDYTLQELDKTGDYDTLFRAAFPQTPRTFHLDILPSWLGRFRLREHAAPESHLRMSVFTDIQAKHCLNVGVRYDFAPYAYLDAHGEFAGFDVDLVKAIAHKWGLAPTAIAFRPLAAQDRALFPLMGMVDLVAAGFTRNNERERYLDFSQTYFVDTQGILVQTKANLRQLCDLQHKNVAITQGSTAIQNLKEEYARRCKGTLAINLVVSIADALAQLQTGEAHGIATNTVVLQAIANADPRFTVLPYTFSREPAGLGVPQNDTLLRDQVNATLQELLRDGTYAAIYCKHFGTRPQEPLELWPRTVGEVPQLAPMACEERAKAAPPPTTYVVKSGDTLYKIAATSLESPFCWTWLRDSNAIPEDKQDHLEIGKTLLIAAEPKRGCALKSKN